MRHVFICPLNDTMKVAVVDLRNEREIYGTLRFQNYTPPNPAMYPFVPAYFQQYQEQPKPLRQFLREYIRGIRPRSFLLVLHDDATDLEANALSELLIACGAKDVPMEYRAFLLSDEPAYLAVTGSKRAVTVTHVIAGRDDTERIFIPLPDADEDAVREAIRELDPELTLPVFTYGVPDAAARVGEETSEPVLVRNFVKIL